MNENIQILTTTSAEMAEAQRKCVSHLLRNSAAALEGVVAFIEDRDRPISAQELNGCLVGVHKVLGRLVSATAQGSLCSLCEEDCLFVKKFTGCRCRGAQE